MKLYTGRGDQGQTDLFGGQRIDKDSLRIEAIGTVDELNSAIGLALSACSDGAMKAILIELQARLFEIGADLASPPRSSSDPSATQPSAIPRIEPAQVRELEQRIDEVCRTLEPMRFFILPGGSELAARLHLARSVCRRAERLCVALHKREPVNEAILIYLNRLSDLLFAMARQANQHAGVPDTPWGSPTRSSRTAR